MSVLDNVDSLALYWLHSSPGLQRYGILFSYCGLCKIMVTALSGYGFPGPEAIARSCALGVVCVCSWAPGH